jgi:hypothetical protein
MKKKFYPTCTKHGDVKSPNCVVKNCNNLTEFSPTMGIFHSKCPEHGLKKLCPVLGCDNLRTYDYDKEKLNDNCLSHQVSFNMNDKIIKVCDIIKNNLLFQWIVKPFNTLLIKDANNIQPMWENIIMAKNPWLSFWFELNDIAFANGIEVNDIVKYLKKSKINLMHAELSREPYAIRFANNNCDMLYDSKVARWIHVYLNTYKIIY